MKKAKYLGTMDVIAHKLQIIPQFYEYIFYEEQKTSIV